LVLEELAQKSDITTHKFLSVISVYCQPEYCSILSRNFFYFDYINSGEPVGLDTPGGASERTATLSYLNDHLDICFGDFKINEHSVGVCVGKKK